MAPDYKGFLATEIVSEQNTISYRNLSRALKIHCNAAKCMLFDFHHKENKKKPGSIYATYLLAGTKKDQQIHGHGHGPDHDTTKGSNGDMPMPSSPPFPPSSMPAASQTTELLEDSPRVTVKTITICREEDLDIVKEQFENITSIHIYALSPGRLPDLQTLSDTGRSVFADHHSKQDPLIHNKDYGIIQNPHVRRRKGKRPMNVSAPQPKIQSTKEEKKIPTVKQEAKKDDAPPSRPSSRDSTTTQESTAKGKPNLKRDASSLFKAFAKQGAKPKLERKDTSASIASSTTDAKMGGMDEEEGKSEDEAMFLDTGTTNKSKKRPNEILKEKEERQAKLRKTMEDDDEGEAQVPKVEDAVMDKDEPPAAKVGEDVDAPSGDADADADAENVDWSDSDADSENPKPKAKPKTKTKSKPPTTIKEEDSAPKRRRGRRKVMKKRTMKDDEGFLVTKEEEAWESFSEEEPVAVKKPVVVPPKSSGSAKVGSSSQKSSAVKGGVGGGAGAGGGGSGAKKKNIMSFFGKK